MDKWVIEKVWKEKGEERTGRNEAGWWFQGKNERTGRTTCLYKDSEDCEAAIKTIYAEPWGV